MKKQLVIVGISLLLLVVGLSGCNEINVQIEENKFIGTWSWLEPVHFPSGWDNSTGNVTFYKNGTYKAEQALYNSPIIGEYYIDAGLHIFYNKNQNNTATAMNYSFYNNNQKFILSQMEGNTTVIFIKKE